MKLNSPLMIIFFTVFIDLVGFGIVLPLSPFYAEHFGATAAQVGLLQASYSFMQLIFAPVWGRLSDRLGRRPILLLSIFCGSISYFIFGLANTLWILFAARMLQGLFGANFAAAQAYVADITTKEGRAKGMGLMGAAFGLGFIVGPALGAYLSEAGPHVANFLGLPDAPQFHEGFPALCAGLLCFTNFVLAYFLLPESLSEENKLAARQKNHQKRALLLANAFKNRKINWLIIILFLSTFAIANMESTLALLLEARFRFGVPETGRLFAFVGIMMALTQGYLLRKMLPLVGERRLILWGPIIAATGFGLLALAFRMDLIYTSLFLLAVGSGLTNPVLASGISLLTDESEQGAMLGVSQSLGSLGRILGPACGGSLFYYANPGAPYILASLVTFATVAIAIMNIHLLPESRGVKAKGVVSGIH